jgi:hypothetical protein
MSKVRFRRLWSAALVPLAVLQWGLLAPVRRRQEGEKQAESSQDVKNLPLWWPSLQGSFHYIRKSGLLCSRGKIQISNKKKIKAGYHPTC